MSTRLAVLTVAAAISAGGAVAVLVPTTADATAPTADSVVSALQADSGVAAPEMGRRHKRLLTPEQRQQLRQSGHLVLTKDTKRFGTITIAVQLGEVSDITATSITLTSKDGYSHTYAITDKTKVRVRRQPAAVSDIALHSKAAVIALVTPTGDNARRIIVRPARPQGTDSRPGVGEPTATNA